MDNTSIEIKYQPVTPVVSTGGPLQPIQKTANTVTQPPGGKMFVFISMIQNIFKNLFLPKYCISCFFNEECLPTIKAPLAT